MLLAERSVIGGEASKNGYCDSEKEKWSELSRIV
jgi:hypothetical protein